MAEMTDLSDLAARLRSLAAQWRQGGAAPDAAALADMDSAAERLTEAAAHIARQGEALAIASGSSDRFIANVSHELRTPLTPALLLVSALQTDPSLPEGVRNDLAMVREQIDLEARLVDDLLDNSRLTRGKMQLRQEPLDLSALLLGIVASRQSQTASGPKLSLDYRAQQRRVHGDPARLRQILSNLLENACKYTPEYGAVQIVATDVDRNIAVDVIDNGRGFDAAQAARIFQAFDHGREALARNFGGLGLGLSIARGLAQLHGGDLTASSAGVGQGATFRLAIPALIELPMPAKPDHHRLRLLLVEDDGQSRVATGRLLEYDGYIVRTAGTFEAALKALQTEQIDMLLCDIQLPDGDGWDLMRRARELHPHIKGLALSGFGADDYIRKSSEAGFEQHLVKPFTMQGLTQAIDRISGMRKWK